MKKLVLPFVPNPNYDEFGITRETEFTSNNGVDLERPLKERVSLMHYWTLPTNREENG